jgi:beclin 1
VGLHLFLCKMVRRGSDEMDRFWHAHNASLLVESQQLSQLGAIRAAYADDSAILEKLDAFCIGHDGVFGTINGLRLGRVAGVAVSGLFGARDLS